MPLPRVAIALIPILFGVISGCDGLPPKGAIVDRKPNDTWTSDALGRGDEAAVIRRAKDDPAYLASRDFVGDTPLMTAVGFCRPVLVDVLLRHGADPNADADDGYTCLLTAIESEGPASAAIVARLIAAGADIHRTGTNGWTPLHMAAARGQVDKARLLLDAGAHIDRRTEIDGCETPLMEAAGQGHAEVVQLLLDRGADPTLWDTMLQHTPLEMARHAMIGADPNVVALLGSPDMVESYRKSHAEVTERMFANSDLPPELREQIRKQMEGFDAAEQYRQEADRIARDGNHREVIRILSKHAEKR